MKASGRFLRRLAAGVYGTVIVLPCVCAAAPVAGAEAGGAVGGSLSWRQILESGGWLMFVLAALSILTVALVIYFLVVLRAAQIAPRSLHRELVERIRAGAYDDARRACEYRPCPLAGVALAAIDYVRGVQRVDPVLLKDVIEGEGARQSASILGQTEYLLDVAVIAPMIGLLGTVFGMLRAFSGVALDIANAKPVVLAAGVSQALVTTAFGLIVGIPAMMFYAYFRRRAAGQLSGLETVATEVLTALLRERPE